MTAPRMSAQTLKVLATFFSSPRIHLSGAQIAAKTKLASGTLYPILVRLDRAGWLGSRWEKGDPRQLGHPLRHFYRMTGLGKREAKAIFEELRHAIGGIVE